MGSVAVKALAGCWLLVACLVGVGCKSNTTPDSSPTPTAHNLERIGNAYVHATVRLNRPPANLDDLLPSLRDQGKTEILLRSPNDNADFEIVWNVDLRMLKAKGSDVPIVAFERVGRDGKRYVLRGRAEVLQFSNSALKSAKFPPNYQLPF